MGVSNGQETTLPMDNLRGAALMTLAMLGFAIEDMFVKLLAVRFPTWQIIGILGLGGALAFATMVRLRGEALWTRAYLAPAVLLRNFGELVGTTGFVTALALIELSTASAILQATPLVVTMGAALFLGEPVGWRRWSAILVGFAGVLLVIRPGTAGFDLSALFALQGVLGLAIRDLATRRVRVQTSSVQLSFLAFLTLLPASALLALFEGTPLVWPEAADARNIAVMLGLAVTSYYAIVAAMRVGEVSYVTPFRYSRIVFALMIGFAAFGERPDTLMLVGCVLIVGSGLFTLWRERKIRPAA